MPPVWLRPRPHPEDELHTTVLRKIADLAMARSPHEVWMNLYQTAVDADTMRQRHDVYPRHRETLVPGSSRADFSVPDHWSFRQKQYLLRLQMQAPSPQSAPVPHGPSIPGVPSDCAARNADIFWGMKKSVFGQNQPPILDTSHRVPPTSTPHLNRGSRSILRRRARKV